MKKLLLSLALLAMAGVASANTFTAEGTVFEPGYAYNFVASRFLAPDGDFEEGSCFNNPTWICTTDSTWVCDWITDLVPLGLWNYSGAHIAWLGGYCGGFAVCHTSFCKDIQFEGSGIISWYWMAYINSEIMHVYATVDGDIRWEFYPDLSDHLLDYQPTGFSWWGPPPAVRTLCFEMDDPGCDQNLGDNYFLDYVEIWWGSPAEAASFSAVKSLY